MTTYEQYVEVTTFVKSVLKQTVFMEGEVIDIKPPYVVLITYGIGNEFMASTRADTMGYSVHCYHINRGRTQQLISDTLDALSFVRTTNGLRLDEPTFAEFINRFEDNLFGGIVTFSVESCNRRHFKPTNKKALTADNILITVDNTKITVDATFYI